jgi:hypothetical protein
VIALADIKRRMAASEITPTQGLAEARESVIRELKALSIKENA